jgi:hypothetical protein
MSSEFSRQGPLDPVERVLAGCTPAPPQVDRDRLMFLAGQASAVAGQAHETSGSIVASRSERTTRRRWLWPVSTAALAATSLALAVALLVRPMPQPQVVYRDRPVLVQPPRGIQSPRAHERDVAQQPVLPSPRLAEGPATHGGYLQTRGVALRIGLDGLGSPAGGSHAANPATYLDLLKALAGARAAGPADPAAKPFPTM